MRELLTPRQVAQAIGVSEASLKRWCDRGLLLTQKTAGGHRRLPLSGVLEFLRTSGHPLIDPAVLGLPSNVGKGETVINRAAEHAQRALEAGADEEFRSETFNLFLNGNALCDLCDKVLAPAFRNIGNSWEHGRIEVFQERRACEICLRTLHELRLMLPALSADAPLAIGGALSGDPYVLSSTMAELSLREAGWRAENFGVGIPVETFCAALTTVKPKLVFLSVSTIPDVAPWIERYKTLRAAATAVGAAVSVGGRALTEEIRRELDYTAYCDTFRHLATFATALRAS